MSEYMGIDISHWQGKVDFKKIAKTKSYCILKVSQRTTRDSMFNDYYNQAAGLIDLGAYIYCKVTSIQDAAEEALFAVMQLKNKKLSCGVWLDLEDNELNKLSILDLKKIIYKEADILKEAGFNVGIYCNRSWYNTKFDNASKKDFPFWIASYGANTGKYESNSRYKPSDAKIWQFTSKGAVNGINGNVDLDVAYFHPKYLWDKKETISVARPTLYKANKNNSKEEVKLLQKNLNEIGFVGQDKKSLTVDGDFGKNTEYAVKQFQLKYNVAGGSDGIYGKNSYETLKTIFCV